MSSGETNAAAAGNLFFSTSAMRARTPSSLGTDLTTRRARTPSSPGTDLTTRTSAIHPSGTNSYVTARAETTSSS